MLRHLLFVLSIILLVTTLSCGSRSISEGMCTYDRDCEGEKTCAAGVCTESACMPGQYELEGECITCEVGTFSTETNAV